MKNKRSKSKILIMNQSINQSTNAFSPLSSLALLLSCPLPRTVVFPAAVVGGLMLWFLRFLEKKDGNETHLCW